MPVNLYRNIRPFKEPLFWSISLVVLYSIYPVSAQDFSFCLFHLLGWENCWGCGIGKSMSCAMHGEFQEAFQYHFMGIFALIIITSRIVHLTINQLKLKT